MGLDLIYKYPDLFNSLDRVTQTAITELIQKGPLESLTLTANAQPAIFTVSYARWVDLVEKGQLSKSSIVCLVGHSLGELTALCVAGSFSFEDGVKLARSRGLFMQEAVKVGEGGMVAVLGEINSELFELADSFEVYPANLNTQSQVVFAGLTENLESFVTKLKGSGKPYKVIPLKVSAPFHTPLLKSARERFRELLNEVEICEPTVPVLSNINGQPYPCNPEEIKDRLADQIVSPVRFVDCVQNAIQLFDCDSFVEIGHGTVLTGLVGKISPNLVKVDT